MGEESVEHSLSGLGDIGANVALLAERIDLLKERTRQIGGITSTVKDLADQSKVLALNAAIEAARAGEHGKGFGIVAHEIRNLADQSIKSTARIRDNLQEIARAIADTAAFSETGRRRTESGLSDVRAAGETVRQMAAMMTENAGGVRQISDTVSQQNAGIAQIFGAVSELAAIMQNTTQRLESTSEAIGRMQSVTERISAIVHTYRL